MFVSWKRVINYFKTSIQHQNTKAKMKQLIHDHKAHLWKNLLTSFLYQFDELVMNYNDVADTSEIINDDDNFARSGSGVCMKIAKKSAPFHIHRNAQRS